MAKNNSDSSFMLIGLAVLAAAGYIIYKEKMQKTPVIPMPGTTVNINKKYPIVFGAYNDDLKPLQYVLGVTQSGTFGPDTLTALKRYGYDYSNYQVIQSNAEIQSMIDRINTYAGN